MARTRAACDHDRVSDVQGIAVEGRSVVLYRETGKPVRVPYPSPSWFVPRQRFEADYHRIGQWWLAHRGPDWHPLVPVAPPRARAARGRRGWVSHWG
jgi:hypothetical protein